MAGVEPAALEATVGRVLREHLGIRVHVEVLEPGAVPRSEGKAVRVVDRKTVITGHGDGKVRIWSTLNAKARAVESRPELADRNMKAVEEMVAKHQAELAAG